MPTSTTPPTIVTSTSSTTSTTVPAQSHWQTIDGGTIVDVTVTPGRPLAGETATFTIRARNDHGPLTWGGVDWGDGDGLSEGSYYCDMIVQNLDGSRTVEGGVPADAPPSDETHTYRHAYRVPGSFKVVVDFATNQCDNRRSIESHGDIVVGPGLRRSNGPEAPTVALSVTQGIDASGSDDDGYVRRIVIDWGDGSPKSPHDFPFSDCVDDGRSWPYVRTPPGMNARTHGQETIFNHTYAKSGHYVIRATVTSSGCTGADPQQGTGTLDFDAPPPGQ